MQTIQGMPFLVTGIILIVIISIGGYLAKKPLNKILLHGALGIYMVILIFCVWFPIYIYPGMRFEKGLVQMIPFFTIIESLSSGSIGGIGRDICANILMTVPYGVMIPFLFKSTKRWKYIINMFGLPLAIELSQLLWCVALDSHYRMADIDDVILNAFGIFIGYVIYKYLPDNIKNFFAVKELDFDGRIHTSDERSDKEIRQKSRSEQS